MSIEEVTMTLMTMALDAGQLRQTAIAANIANVNTTGYTPLSVSFEDQLEAARTNLQSGGSVMASSLAGVRAQMQTIDTSLDKNAEIELDKEVAGLMTNAVHQQALLKGVSRHFAMLQMAVTEGKK